MDEVLLITKCLEGNTSAQNYLYNTFRPAMLKVVSKYIDCPFIAEEILNDGFIRVYKGLATFNFQGSFEGWMKKIMFHSVANAFERDSRIKGGKKNLKVLVSLKNNLNLVDKTEISIKYDYEKILNCIEKVLPKITLIVFKMYLDGYTHTEIGKKLNISEGTSKWHIFEAKSIIKNNIFKIK